MRDGHSWTSSRDTGEQYDLVVAGGGISGLSAARFEEGTEDHFPGRDSEVKNDLLSHMSYERHMLDMVRVVPGVCEVQHLNAARSADGVGITHVRCGVGRADVLATSFETYERNMREQLGRTLDAGDFDPVRDITAITVNRWPHGYTQETSPLFEPMLPEEQGSNVVVRRTFGSIAIADADAAAAACTNAAIDQAYRAVSEIRI
jgi:hypothetical protein